MRITEETKFPHPVLAPGTADFIEGEFDAEFWAEENLRTGALTLKHRITLTENEIRKLVETGKASVGCFVKCRDTYYSELRILAWPSGRSDFAPGTLLNRVTIRPVVWLTDELSSWDPGTMHEEFSPPISLERGDIVAIGEEQDIWVGQAKLAPVESIFELDSSPDVPEGSLQVDLDGDRITILAGKKTHEDIRLLREQSKGRPVVMNAVYLPAVMEVLDALSGNASEYEGLRWFTPFEARCQVKGVDPSDKTSILEKAQLLLDGPAGLLSHLLAEDE